MVRDPSDGSEYELEDPMSDEELREEQFRSVNEMALFRLAQARRVLNGSPEGPEAA